MEVARCDTGAGNYVVISGDDGMWYHFLHLMPGLNVGRGQVVRAGQRLGLMGNTANCTGGTTAVHLHFEMRARTNSIDNDPYFGPRDPYPSVKNRFTRPGYAAVAGNNAQTPNGLLTTAWRNVLEGNYAGRIALVGWPASVTRPNGYVANPDWYYTRSRCSPGFACWGYKQFLGNGDGGFDGQGLMRSGVLTQRDPPNGTAFWVHGLIYKRYSEMAGYDAADEEDSFLGWPTSYEFRDSRGLTRQNFEGGCIANDGTGNYVPARYGTFPCIY